MIYYCKYRSPIGEIIMYSDGINLLGLNFNHDNIKESGAVLVNYKSLNIFHKVNKWLNNYFLGKKTYAINIPILLEGSKFSKMVWEIIGKIKYGDIITYSGIAKEVATRLNKKYMSAQAVGNAISKNPILIIIPCHRVIGSNGNLVGYSGGIERKLKLLQIEGHKIIDDKVSE